jgi:alanine dehydrogenase
MILGVPKETKRAEQRVALLPVGVEELVRRGHTVLVEAGAGRGSGFDDERYRAAGAEIVPRASDVWERADMIVKVKEPTPEEYGFLRRDLVILPTSTSRPMSG